MELGKSITKIRKDNKLTQNDFEEPIRIDVLEILNAMIRRKDFNQVKLHLPESFLQRRIIVTNYKTLIHIIKQRKNHRLKVWTEFNNYLIENLEQKHIIKRIYYFFREDS